MDEIEKEKKIKKHEESTNLFVSFTTIFVLGLMVGAGLTAYFLFSQTGKLLDHIKVESFTMSVNESAIVQTFFTEMDKRGYNITNLPEVNISGNDS
jgi:hypothetical protein